ncbi:MAG: DUF192 domain-containing protein [Myxococcales bacterium]|nr:DUF192 domain-containing protein [Myxococcales bacterium]
MRRLLIALVCAGACHSQAAPTMTLPSGAVRFETPRGPWVVRVEIADTDESRTRGLMFRRNLPQDHGMVFVFPTTEEHSFWMHNTLIGLDMIFLGDDRAVLGVVTAAPNTDTLRSVHKPSRYVIEVSAGEASAHAIGPGTRAAFIDIPE